jgi:hypothetical protein
MSNSIYKPIITNIICDSVYKLDDNLIKIYDSILDTYWTHIKYRADKYDAKYITFAAGYVAYTLERIKQYNEIDIFLLGCKPGIGSGTIKYINVAPRRNCRFEENNNKILNIIWTESFRDLETIEQSVYRLLCSFELGFEMVAVYFDHQSNRLPTSSKTFNFKLMQFVDDGRVGKKSQRINHTQYKKAYSLYTPWSLKSLALRLYLNNSSSRFEIDYKRRFLLAIPIHH